MNFNTIIQFILPITTVLATGLSIISIFYTWHQNRLKIEVDISIDTQENQPLIKLCVFNIGYRPVALINCKLLVNNYPINIKEGIHQTDRSKNYGASAYSIKFDQKIDFPHTLKEGEAIFFSLTERQIAAFLYYNDFPSKIKLSGFYKTAQKKIYKTKSIDIDFEKYYKLN